MKDKGDAGAEDFFFSCLSMTGKVRPDRQEERGQENPTHMVS